MDGAVAGAASHLRNAADHQVSAPVSSVDEEIRRRNVRTALWLAATAVAVFVMFLLRYGMSSQ
ncbi:MAG: cytochrome oxidase small assembly protein [Gammaproteobacteria bacterium]|jgi:type VI protein secretion system component VasF|nr:cytochrome oxidase small assembly protein [Gammaproteobacteria bacterium]MBU0770473.1 cytochrome oxidase small assembly protein [Gammaproteobacteria bacterium]MBU0856351.1 cytochrome oxidase small assembly protein [Gammaproteobacteria bacterium]MBU1845350.1 cytochrome oxidase small assembly protein [Gammaproteobacteria bacterium]